MVQGGGAKGWGSSYRGSVNQGGGAGGGRVEERGGGVKGWGLG